MAYYDKSLEEITQKIIDNIHDAVPEADTKEGTFIRNVFVNPTADQITAMYGDMKLLRLSQSVLTAIGDELDLLATNYFITRKEATRSTGKIRFYLKNTNKPSSEIKDNDVPEAIIVPSGTQISTVESYTSELKTFETVETLYYTRDDIKNLVIDGETGFRYIEAVAQSVDPGLNKNVTAGEITVLNDSIEGVNSVVNPFSFTGGTDYESDADLARRIELAITGNNVGTKDGYLSYTLNQNNVVDAKVVGAGDNIMFRDGGYIDEAGEYIYGQGGCVDIYVRGHQRSEEQFTFQLTSDYVRTSSAYSNIVLPKQPILEILSIVSTTTGETLVNADEFETERYTRTDGDEVTIDTKYCTDILWDFSITDSFPDTDYYSIPAGYTQEQVTRLKNAVDNELTEALTYMSNMSYSIDWSTTYEKDSDGGSTSLFKKVYYNNDVYKLIAKDGTDLDGRMFILKNDKIYVRAYVEPDYILQKDTTNYAGSMVAADSIRWLNTRKLITNDELVISYAYDYLIHQIQAGMEEQRCLTADVLLKQAIEVPIEIIVTVLCYNTATIARIKRLISTVLSTYINSTKTLGGNFDKSDIVHLVKQVNFVDEVDLDTLQISIKGYAPQKKIAIADNEYFNLDNLIINASYNTSVNA